MNPFMVLWRDIARKCAGTVLIHHDGKTGQSGYRGSTGIMAGVDMGWGVSEKDDLFTLRTLKTRYTVKQKINYRCSFDNDALRLSVSDPTRPEDVGHSLVQALEIIRSTPGLTTMELRQAFEDAFGRTRGRKLVTVIKPYCRIETIVEGRVRKDRFYPKVETPRTERQHVHGEGRPN